MRNSTNHLNHLPATTWKLIPPLILLCLPRTSLENFEFRQFNSRKYTGKNYVVLKCISSHFTLTAERSCKLFLFKSISGLNIKSTNEKNVRIYGYCWGRSVNLYISGSQTYPFRLLIH